MSADELKAKRKQIEDLLKRARAGEDFEKLATQYSEDPGTKDTGGEVKISRDGKAPPEFEAAAFSLKTNQISDVVETVYGYHVIKLLEKIPAKKFELAKVSTDMKDLSPTAARKLNKIAPGRYTSSLKKEAQNVEILDP